MKFFWGEKVAEEGVPGPRGKEKADEGTPEAETGASLSATTVAATNI